MGGKSSDAGGDDDWIPATLTVKGNSAKPHVESLPKPQGAGDTKKVRRMRKKLLKKVNVGSIDTFSQLQQCESVGICVKPKLVLHLKRHGHQPTLSAKEVRQLILQSAIGSSPPKAVELRNLPAVRATLIVTLTGAAATPASNFNCDKGDSVTKPPGNALSKVTVPPSRPLEGFSESFRQRFPLCAGLRISNGGFSGEDSTEGNGSLLKSLADAFLYAPLSDDSTTFSSKKRKHSGSDTNRERKTPRDGTNPGPEDGNTMLDVKDNDGVVKGGSACGEEGANGRCNSNESANDTDGLGDLVKSTNEEGEDSNCEENGEIGSQCHDGGDSSDEEDGSNEDEPSPALAMEAYLLTPQELKENGFPLPDAPDDSNTSPMEQDEASIARNKGDIALPTKDDAENILSSLPELTGMQGYVQTQPLSDGDGEEDVTGPRMFGLDCEMCMTEEGSELTRVTLVNSEHEVIMDELVKPENRIIDYATRWSGITEEMLEAVDTRLHQVQAAMLQTVDAGDILVGHSLENDLRALKIVHLRCMDTSLLYPHPKQGRRSSLRHLVSMYLRRTIQGSMQGHNSSEDAIAALELAQLKISKGPTFGAERCINNVFDMLHRKSVPCAMIASSEQCRRHVSGSAAAISSFSDDGVVKAVLKELKNVSVAKGKIKPPLVWAELEGPKTPTIQDVCSAAAGGRKSCKTFLDDMDAAWHAAGQERRVGLILDGLPPGVVVFVIAQGVNPQLPKKLNKQRMVCEDRRSASVWSTEQGRLLEALEYRARDGCIFTTVTLG